MNDECTCKVCGAQPGEEHRSYPWTRILNAPMNLPLHLEVLTDLGFTAFMDTYWK